MTVVGILRRIPLYVLYFARIGTCTPNKNYVMNYVDGTHCNAINSLYYIYIWLSVLIFYVLDGLAFFIKLNKNYLYFCLKN